MTDTAFAQQERPIAPRQDRLEAEIGEVLRRGGTRSSLQTAVYQFADYARARGTPPEAAIETVRGISNRAAPEMAARGTPAVGDSEPDRLSMMVRWLTSRYYRDD